MAIAVIMTVIMSDGSVLQVCLQLQVRGVYMYIVYNMYKRVMSVDYKATKRRLHNLATFEPDCAASLESRVRQGARKRERDADTHTDTHKYICGVQYSERKRYRE